MIGMVALLAICTSSPISQLYSMSFGCIYLDNHCFAKLLKESMLDLRGSIRLTVEWDLLGAERDEIHPMFTLVTPCTSSVK